MCSSDLPRGTAEDGMQRVGAALGGGARKIGGEPEGVAGLEIVPEFGLDVPLEHLEDDRTLRGSEMSIDVHGVAHRVHAGVATVVHHVGVAMRAIGIGQLFPPQHGGVEVFVGKSARDVGENVEDER